MVRIRGAAPAIRGDPEGFQRERWSDPRSSATGRAAGVSLVSVGASGASLTFWPGSVKYRRKVLLR